MDKKEMSASRWLIIRRLILLAFLFDTRAQPLVGPGPVTPLLLCTRIPLYWDLWEAALGDELQCKREPSNLKDRYAVDVINIIMHIPAHIVIAKLI